MTFRAFFRWKIVGHCPRLSGGLLLRGINSARLSLSLSLTCARRMMSLQGPLIVVAEPPAADLVEALGSNGAFPIVETGWADAPAAFLTVKPSAVVIAEPGPPANEESARMLCLQIATSNGPIVPMIARVRGEADEAVPIALTAEATLTVGRLIGRYATAVR